jgi:hypothetical protein
MNATTTRRALLAGAPAIALAGLLTAPASALATATRVSPDLDAAIRAHAAARAAAITFRSEVFGPIEDAHFALRDTVPHVTTLNGFTNVSGEVRHLTTSDTATVHMSRSVLRDFDAGTHFQSQRDTSYISTLRELVEAADARNAAIAGANHKLEYDAADARLQELEGYDLEVIGQVVRVPAASIADLLAKVEFMQAEDGWEIRESVDHIVADVRRLAVAV